jgi:dUTP pyrophosphatase
MTEQETPIGIPIETKSEIQLPVRILGNKEKVYLRDGSSNCAGKDLFYNGEENEIIEAGKSLEIKTGISMAIPIGYYGQICSRSGLGFNHDIIAFQGIIDADYRGEIRIKLYNFGQKSFTIKPGSSIAQIILIKVPKKVITQYVDELDKTEREENGFGSTEKRIKLGN